MAGKRIIFVSFAVAAYEIFQTEDKTTETLHQGAIATAGIAGGWAAGAGVVAVGACAATFVGSYGGRTVAGVQAQATDVFQL
ncbi:hypothetical protein JHU04_004288 [Brenneria sp. 4F2]|nr:hypothetical protein [Brenneria bubanii]